VTFKTLFSLVTAKKQYGVDRCVKCDHDKYPPLPP